MGATAVSLLRSRPDPRPVTAAVPISPRTVAVLVAASVAGMMMLAWPLLLQVPAQTRIDPPFLFLALLPIVIAVMLAEVSEGGMDPRVLAILGVLSAANALLRGVSAGTAGVELVFFLLILAGRVFGPGFGFVLGCTSLFASALMTAGVGPWLPFQMLVSAWVGMGAGLLPRRVRGRREILMLAAYGVVASYAFGLLMNLSGWPFVLGIAVPGHEGSLSYVPGAPLLENLHRFAVYTLLTSTGSWDTGRAITTSVALVVLGPAVLTTLRRASRRATVTGVVTGPPAGRAARPERTVGRGPEPRNPAPAPSARVDQQDAVVGRRGEAPAVPVAGGDPQPSVRGDRHGAHPAVAPDEEVGGRRGPPPGDVDAPQPLAPQRGEPEVAVDEGQPGRRGDVGPPHDLGIDEALLVRRAPRPGASRSCRPAG